MHGDMSRWQCSKELILICQVNDYDSEQTGKHMLETLEKLQNGEIR